MSRSPFSVLCAIATLVLTGIAAADGVRIADSPGLGSFWTIQSAVDAAADGDVLLVGTGNYESFVVDGKSLWIVAPAGQDVRIDGTIEIRNIPGGESVVISNVSVLGRIPAANCCSTSDPALRVTDNAGHVRFQDSSFFGGNGGPGGPFCGQESHGGPGAVLANSVSVVFVGCSLAGGWGDDGSMCSTCCGGDGGNALESQTSAIGLFDCLLVGGQGGDFGLIGGDGGNACDATGLGLFASGCVFQGGSGGTAAGSNPIRGGNGGDGIALQISQAQLLDNSLAAGPGGIGSMGASDGEAGQPILNMSGVVNQYPGKARSLSGPPVASDNQPWVLTVSGEAGDNVFLLSSRTSGFGFVKAITSLWAVPVPFFFSLAPHGTIGASGSLSLTLDPLQVRQPATASRFFMQALIVKAGGGAVLSGPIHPVILRRFGLPDCNANGLMDYVDTIEGVSADLNTNLIPDECEYNGPTWHVSTGGLPNADGSPQSPYPVLRLALEAAQAGHEIVVADGTYTGPHNRGLNFEGRDLVVRSENGPANCIIDCEDAARAFLFDQGETSASVLRGLTITRGLGDDGGGVKVINSSPTIEDCVFDACTALRYGGGLYVFGGDTAISDCRFLGKAIGLSASGGGGMYARGGGVTVEFCVFTGIRAGGGAGLYLNQPDTEYLVSHCVFRNNQSGGTGGAAVLDGFPGRKIDLVNSLFENNRGRFGGGAAVQNGANGVVSGCTFVGNIATDFTGNLGGGGALYFSAYTFLNGVTRIDNTILWNNMAVNSKGHQLSLREARVALNYTDMQGGQAGVSTAGQAMLFFEAGNLDVDPQFVGPADFRLGPTSPCIDAGNNFIVPLDVLDLDGDGNVSEPIPFDLDRLARFRDVPSVPDTGLGTPPIVDMGAYERHSP